MKMCKQYCGIDLHSNNGYYGIVDQTGKRLIGRRIMNDVPKVLEFLEPRKADLLSLGVESTYNWYWLVDALMDAGYDVKLANPAAMEQYEGLKDSNDKTDAFWIADQLRLGILPTGHIYPKTERLVRDMLRRRTLFVQQRTAQILSATSTIERHTSIKFGHRELLKLEPNELEEIVYGNECLYFILSQQLQTIRFISQKISMIEKNTAKRIKLRPEFEKLLSIPGVGLILGLTIMLETGDVGRFQKVGNYTSYCRAVKAERTSNGKKKGSNNRKNGNKYLSWTFVEAAKHCVRVCDRAKRFYHRKVSKSNAAVATKALSSKLSKAAYFIMRNQEEFDVVKMFG
jgi:transposase